MPSQYTPSLEIQQMGNGEDSNTWGTITNNNWQYMEYAVAGVINIAMSNANRTLNTSNGSSNEARYMVLNVTGSNSAVYQVIAPLQPKFYIISNNTSGGYAIQIAATGGSTVVSIPNGVTAQVYCDGSTGFFSAQTGSAGNFTVNGTLTANGVSDLGALSATTGTFSGAVSGTTITASTQFTGPGTGLTGTAASLSIGGSAASATTATNLANGAANQIHYQTASNTSSFITAPSTANTGLVWNGSAFVWQATGGAQAGGAVYENVQTISSNYTMTTGYNGESAGPITVATGVVVQIPTGSRWVIV